MNKLLNCLTVLRGLKNNELIYSLFEYAQCAEVNGEKYFDFISQIYVKGAENNLLSYVQDEILYDVNPFSVTCSAGNRPTKYLSNAYERDVNLIIKTIQTLPNSADYCVGCSNQIFSDLKPGFSDKLFGFYSINGHGQFIFGKAYKYAEGEIAPLKNTAPITLKDLKNYHDEKCAVKNNIDAFLSGLPYAHMLLYGDRGTGKSSTVHAILNEYAHRGLRLIEVARDDIAEIAKIKQQLSSLPLKFIIFIDDLSFNENDQSAAALRAAVEGSVISGSNVMIVATSNRRHIIKESFTDRDNSVHSSDCIQEQLSLSDRFGLTVMFSTTDKNGYLSIVDQLAEDMKLATPQSELHRLAEQWAVINGGRSPRKAKQFIDFVYSCEKSNRAIEF